MNKTEQRWTKPELIRLGKITDVAGPNAGSGQNATKS